MTTIKPAEHTDHGIVVGITAHDENNAALRWASDQARRTGQRVTLAHVVTPILPPSTTGARAAWTCTRPGSRRS